ncbi:conserved hypothetical protein [Desulforamulus reducens MI-1]|uniref:Uncharacterized protein n=1 Tax=Desulforamulus reducens (strain ATCC BAA-1160 / DSM 100696 / MI-1) TaxID=349161 RepID=A4J2S0_DESRM|nr:hypothetical protein [Desulforamulus reducens]ABO49373.1 conserved hypothetical protein [Desulforamulus reducens MI-1]
MKKILAFLLTLHIFTNTAFASGVWDYKINSSDTPSIVDSAVTTAAVDTALNEVRLPENTASMISFWPDGSPDYIMMTPTKIIHFSFNGTGYDENIILEITPESSPTAIVATGPFPDVKLGVGAQIRHMSFDGSGYTRNAPLEKSGMDGAYTLSSNRAGEFASLVGNQAQRYMFDGSSTVRVPSLEPNVDLDSPVDAGIFPESLHMATLERDKLRVFRRDSYGNPLSTVTLASSLSNPKDLSTSGAGDIGAIIGNTAPHYSYGGGFWAYNPSLSITSGLTNPKAIALRHKSFDRIIVDGNEAKYYRWTGTQLVYDSAKSKVIPDLGSITYRPYAVIQSKAKDPMSNVKYVRARAYHLVPDGTAVTWSVTADGNNWVKKWRVRGTPSGTTCEVSQDNGLTWIVLGDAAKATPEVDTKELWAEVTPGRTVKWKAELTTSNMTITPKIKPFVVGGVAVNWAAGTPPNVPIIDLPAVCYTTSTPTISWTYSDPDGDPIFAHQLQIKRKSDGVLIYDSGKVVSDRPEHKINTSYDPSVPGPLWNSGDYEFTVQLKVWDSTDMESLWSPPGEFCVLAFERPRIAEIVSAPTGQDSPKVLDTVTHKVITPGMLEDQLPKAKAGSRVKLLVDSIGPINTLSTVKFPYLSLEATVKTPIISKYPLGSKINTWEIDFWTDANLEKCPSGTLVTMQITGDAGAKGVATLNSPPYAAGVIVTQGSIYEDWFPVLQGRDGD